MALAVLSGFILAALAPFICRMAGRHAGWVLALLPASLTVYFATFIPGVNAGDPVRFENPWVPGLELTFSFYVDGLSLLFALLISGIGAFIVLYAGSYLAGHRDLPRFYVIILAFMASMLGLVLADNVIALFIFWELTSITSYLLIGFDHEDEKARKAALQGLLVTAGGGLALLAGVIMLALTGDSFELSEIVAGDAIRAHDLYAPILILVLIAAFTKSAQFPFHFWLPNAMAAPTPVSAYLHSATMVKAGVYLLARLQPALGGTEPWIIAVSLFGAVTMFTGAFLAIQTVEIKRILAYSTVMALGTLTMLIGIGTPAAITAAVTFLLAHSLYKGALFLVAGALDHATGTKKVTEMGGLRRVMPFTATAAAVAALSLAGLPPLFGFVGKELLLEAVLDAPALGALLLALTVGASILVVAVAGIVALRPFFGPWRHTPRHPHEAPLAMLAGPVVLAVLGLAFGLAPTVAETHLLAAAAHAVQGAPVDLHLALWHGVNAPLLISLGSLLGGALIYIYWEAIRERMAGLARVYDRLGPERGYDRGMDGLVWLAWAQTRVLQNGSMQNYLLTVLITLVLLTAYTLFLKAEPAWSLTSDLHFYELVIGGLIVAAALFVAVTRSRLGAVASLGIVGFGIALLYVLFSAPDLGITQILIETLTVILLILVLFKLPGFLQLSTPLARLRDGLMGIVTGGLISVTLLTILDHQGMDPISGYFVENAEPLGHGRNIVNVILVDFRALDTLGEIYVLALAAIGVYAMIKLRAEDRR